MMFGVKFNRDKVHLIAGCLVLALALIQSSGVEGRGFGKGSNNQVYRWPGDDRKKCDPLVTGGARRSFFHHSNGQRSSARFGNQTAGILRATTRPPVDCFAEPCDGADCPVGTDICDKECGFYGHPDFCDCFYHCSGCDRPTITPCPDGTMFDLEAKCCATAVTVDCGDRIPYDEYVPTTTEQGSTQPTTAEATTEAITTKAATTEATTAEATTKEPTTPEATTKEPTTPEATTKEPTTPEATTKEPTTPEATTKEPTTPEATTKEPTTKEATTTELPTTTSLLTTANGAVDFQCTADGLFPYPSSCHCFIECVGGVALVVNCPPGMEYDPSQKKCRPAWGCVPALGGFASMFGPLDTCNA